MPQSYQQMTQALPQVCSQESDKAALSRDRHPTYTPSLPYHQLSCRIQQVCLLSTSYPPCTSVVNDSPQYTGAGRPYILCIPIAILVSIVALFRFLIP